MDTGKIDQFPEDILQKNVFTFLGIKDLFCSVRGVNTHWADLMKEVYNEKMNMLIANYIKITEHKYERECLIKLLAKKKAYLDNYKSMITIYTENDILSNSLLHLIDMITNEKIKALYEFFLSFFILNEGKNLINYDRSLLRSFVQETNYIKQNIYYIVAIENDMECYYSLEQLNDFKNEFDKLDKLYLEEVSDISKILYCYMSFVIVYLILKKEGIQERNRIKEIDDFLEKPCDWKEKQFFYEAVFKLVNFTSFTSYETKQMLEEFEKQSIKHPLQYSTEETENIYKGKVEKLLVPQLLDDENVQSSYQKLVDKRIALTYKILLLEEFYEFFKHFKVENNMIRIDNVEIPLQQFLLCLIVTSKQGRKATEENILYAKKIIDGIKNNKDVCPCCGDELEEVPNEGISRIQSEDKKEKD